MSSGGFTLTQAGAGWRHITPPRLDEPAKARREEPALQRSNDPVPAPALRRAAA